MQIAREGRQVLRTASIELVALPTQKQVWTYSGNTIRGNSIYSNSDIQLVNGGNNLLILLIGFISL